MWEAAKAALAEATELVIFGFSFPKTDVLIRTLFQQSLDSAKLRQVAIIDLDPEAVRTRIEESIPGLDVHYELLPTRPDYGIPDWIQVDARVADGNT
jgi:hypothetical protein